MEHIKARAKATVIAFGRRVREHRLALGISQRELARRARLSGVSISLIESGKTNPSLVVMTMMADALACNVTDLLRSWSGSESYVMLSPENAKRAREAVAILGAVLAARKYSPRTPRPRYKLPRG
jgi:transcriptional regulator with XRE-family HTH domain